MWRETPEALFPGGHRLQRLRLLRHGLEVIQEGEDEVLGRRGRGQIFRLVEELRFGVHVVIKRREDRLR